MGVVRSLRKLILKLLGSPSNTSINSSQPGAISPRRPHLSALRNRFASAFGAVGLWAGIANEITLPVQAGNEHGTVMVVATRLVGRNLRQLRPFRSYVSQALAETAAAKFGGTAKKLNRIISAEWRRGHLHRPIMLVA